MNDGLSLSTVLHLSTSIMIGRWERDGNKESDVSQAFGSRWLTDVSDFLLR